MGDRKVEENCLNRAIELALKQCGWTKKFAKRLYAGVQDGFKEVDRVRPDFVVLCPPTENEKSTLIGIEHFRVDMHVTQKKTNDTKKVSFVILYFVETFAPTKERVVIVRTKKIREQLKRQSEAIYKYCGDDFRLEPFELPYEKSILEAKCETSAKGENQIEISMSRDETPVQYFEMHLFAAAHQAYCYEKANIPYATTESAFLIIELLRGYILYWKKLQIPGAEWMVYPIMKHYDKATRDKRYEEFKKRWNIDDGEHDE